MRRAQDLVYGVTGQTLSTHFPEGRPSSVTSVTVYAWDAADDSDPESATTGSASLGSVNTTLSAAGGYGQDDARLVTLTSATGIVAGGRYLITAATGAREWCEAQSVSGSTVTLRQPLHNAYASGATFQAASASISVDDTWVATEGNLTDASGATDDYRVRWVYVVSGETRALDTYFSLVRYAGKHNVTPTDVDDAMPGWLDSLPTDHRESQGRVFIDEAHAAVKLDLLGFGVDDADLASGDVTDALVRRKTMHLTELARYLSGGSQDDSRVTLTRAHYAELLDSTVRLAANAKQRDKTGAGKTALPQSLTRR